MKELLKRLLEERARAWEETKAVLEPSQTEKRDLSSEEQESWAKANADLDSLDQRIAELEERIKREQIADERRAELEKLLRPAEDPTPVEEETEEQRVLDWARGKGPRALEISLSGLQIRRHDNGLWEVRDLVKATAAAGGDTVPVSFRRDLYEHLIDNTAIRLTNATVLTTASGENLLIPKTTAHGTAAQLGEGSALAEADPTFGQGTLQAYKYGALIQVSSELLQDTGVDLLGYLARSFGQALANVSGADFILGTGTSEPQGVITAGSVGVTGGTPAADGPSYNDLVDMQHSVIEGYRRAGWWVMRDATIAKIRKLKDTQNRPLWQPGLVGGQPNMILDRPYVADPNVPAVGSNATSVAFGDFSRHYYIRDVGGVRFERSDDFAFSTDLVTFRAILRADGKIIDAAAVRTYKGGTA